MSCRCGDAVGDPPPVVEVEAGGGGGALTLKSVPVTTVTCEPGFTCEGSSAMITAPDMELATAWAAARLGRRLGRVVDDRLGLLADRRAVADRPDVEAERLQALRRVGRLVVGARAVHHRDRHRRRGRQRAARVGVLVARLQPEELVDGGVVLRLGRELDVPVAAALVDVAAELVHRHRQRQLRRRVDVDVVVAEDQADHVAGREARVDRELPDHAGDQLLVGDGIAQALGLDRGGQHAQELVVAPDPRDVALRLLGPVVRVGAS